MHYIKDVRYCQQFGPSYLFLHQMEWLLLHICNQSSFLSEWATAFDESISSFSDIQAFAYMWFHSVCLCIEPTDRGFEVLVLAESILNCCCSQGRQLLNLCPAAWFSFFLFFFFLFYFIAINKHYRIKEQEKTKKIITKSSWASCDLLYMMVTYK